jgi:hypothetical protein
MRGDLSVTPVRALSGRLTVDAVGGLIGLPVQVSGTLEAPKVSFSRAAVLGAAIGTAALPGAGTVAGAQLGEKVGNTLQAKKDKLRGSSGTP